VLFSAFVVLLADRYSMIDCLHNTLGLTVGVGVESCTIMFLAGHFLFTSSDTCDTFAVGMYRLARTTDSEKPNRLNFRVWNSVREYVFYLFSDFKKHGFYVF